MYFYTTEYVNEVQFNNFVERYRSLSLMTGDTILQLEKTTEAVSRSALNRLFDLEKKKGLPSGAALKKLARESEVSHFYITDKSGRFIRNTDIPVGKNDQKLFDFCAGYRDLLTTDGGREQTPILPSFPYTGPYKFTMIANHNKTKILEVGMHLSFITRTLSGVISSDANIVSLGLYTPTGFNLGWIDASGISDNVEKLSAEELGAPILINNDTLYINTVIPTAYAQCCECAVKGVVEAKGSYYYILKAGVSLVSLHAAQAAVRNRLFVIIILSLAIAYILAIFLSKKLVKRINKIQEITQHINITGVLNDVEFFKGKDEIAQLGNSFRSMVNSIRSFQGQKLAAEREKALSRVATQLAHDIRSPVSALEIALEDVDSIDNQRKALVLSATNRIKEIVNAMLSQYKKTEHLENSTSNSKSCTKGIVKLIETLIKEKNIQVFESHKFNLINKLANSSVEIQIDTVDLRRAISNVIDNAVEAMPNGGVVTIEVYEASDEIIISIQDEGQGFSRLLLEDIKGGRKIRSLKNGFGLGLEQVISSVAAAGGSVDFQASGSGAMVILKIKKVEKS